MYLAREICSGESGRTSAHLASGIDDHYFELARSHGKEAAKHAAEAHSAAIDLIEKIVKDENIDCEFSRVDGYLFLAPEHSQGYLILLITIVRYDIECIILFILSI